MNTSWKIRVLTVLCTTAVLAGSSATEAQVKVAPQPQPNNKLAKPPLVPSPTLRVIAPPPAPGLSGWVDLHAHPMTHLGFGGKLIHGAPDVGSIIPADANCQQRVKATSLNHALGPDNSTHGGWGAFDNGCGDDIRKAVIDQLQASKGAVVTPDRAGGAPDFQHWPKWDDITHQKMWIDWIRRAHFGGLRVMVSLATHNSTLAAAVSGPGDGPTDDKASGDLQVVEMIELVQRNRDFMEIAKSSADLRRIVKAGKLAVVLGVELDAIGNFHGKHRAPSLAEVKAEIVRLQNLGVRYIFPVHVIDNHFSGTAAYEGAFNLSNYRESGSFWSLACSPRADNVNFRYAADGFDAAVALVKATKLGIDIARNPPTPPSCGAGSGHMNTRGLTPLGEQVLKEMMKLGMLIDIDHMSQKAANRALTVAEAVSGGGYPLNSGHNGYRGTGGSENSRTAEQLQRLAALKGVFGVGIEEQDPDSFIREFLAVSSRMRNAGVGLGTDLNGLVKGAKPKAGSLTYSSSFPKLKTGNKTWDYNTDGVAHYGLLADFVAAVGSRGSDGANVKNSLNQSAEFFAQMWEQAEKQRSNVR